MRAKIESMATYKCYPCEVPIDIKATDLLYERNGGIFHYIQVASDFSVSNMPTCSDIFVLQIILGMHGV
jgi:hypothetical protein